MRHPLDAYAFCPHCGSSAFLVQDFKSKRCKDCGFQVFMNAAASCVAIIQDAQGRVLITRRAREPYKGMLDFPGGFVDIGEDIQKALKRELQEETSLNITESRFLFSIPNVYPYGGLDVHTLDFFFLCKAEIPKGGIKASDDVQEAFFMSLENLKEEDIGPKSMKECLRRLNKDVSLLLFSNDDIA